MNTELNHKVTNLASSATLAINEQCNAIAEL